MPASHLAPPPTPSSSSMMPSSNLRTKPRKTMARKPANKLGATADTKGAHLAGLTCALFPLADSGVPTVTGVAGGTSTDLLPNLSHLSLSEPKEYTYVVGDNIILGTNTIGNLRSRLKTKADLLTHVQKPKDSCFVKSAHKFLSQTASLRPNQLSDFQNLVTLIGSYTVQEVKQLSFAPQEADHTFLGAVEFYVNTVREVVSQEPNSRAILSHKLLVNRDAVQPLLSKFLNTTRTITGDANTKLAEWLRVVFEIKPEVHQFSIQHIKSKCNERVAFSELDDYIRQLESGNVPTATVQDFLSLESFQEWRTKELAIMQGFKRVYLLRNPHLRPLDEPSHVFLPPQRQNYFRIILGLCLEHDMATSMVNADANDFMELSKLSKSLLNECALRWRISKNFREICMLDIIVNQYVTGAMLVIDAFPKFMSLLEYMAANFSTCRHQELEYYRSVLQKFEIHIKSDLEKFLELRKRDQPTARHTFNSICTILRKISTDPVWISYTNATDDIDNKLQFTVGEALVNQFKKTYSLINDHYKDSNNTAEHLRIFQLVRFISTDLDKLTTYFPDPLIHPNVFVRSIAEKKYLNMLNLDMENLRYFFTENKDLDMDSILGTGGLYEAVSDLYTKVDLAAAGLTFNTEELFRPFIMEWLSRADEKWIEWAEKAVYVEKFKPIHPPTTMYSTSVRDIFTFYNNGLKFINKLKNLSASKKENMSIAFLRILGTSLETYLQCLQQEFNDLENGTAEDISVQSCIKLNNVMGCRLQLKYVLAELGLSSGGRINPNAVKKDTILAPNTVSFRLEICRAYDLQVCDTVSSDPYVVVQGSKFKLQTKVIESNLNPEFQFNWPNHMKTEQSFLDFIVYDKDFIEPHDVCGRPRDDKLFLRNSKYEDYLTHDEWFNLEPQGRLLVRLTRLGEIADIDYWVLRSEQTINFTGEYMVKVYIDRIVLDVSAKWRKVVDTLAPNSFFGGSSVAVTETNVEKEILPILQFVDKNMGILNENLDKLLLNSFLRERYAAVLGSAHAAPKENLDDAASQRLHHKTQQEDMERDSPTLLAILIWNELCVTMRTQLNTYGFERTAKNARKVKSKEAQKRKPLTEAEMKQVQVMEMVLEYLKAFFYCEFDGRNVGIPLNEMENREYENLRRLIGDLLKSSA
ncbi:hypothetical protein HDV05_005807 [Chytridiales sp. JEL 0842]|nr:hypothetical protein HDV05_005807 [Chytridiales sp. JEL 0842]